MLTLRNPMQRHRVIQSRKWVEAGHDHESTKFSRGKVLCVKGGIGSWNSPHMEQWLPDQEGAITL